MPATVASVTIKSAMGDAEGRERGTLSPWWCPVPSAASCMALYSALVGFMAVAPGWGCPVPCTVLYIEYTVFHGTVKCEMRYNITTTQYAPALWKMERHGYNMLDMAIYNKVKILIAEKELRENRKLSYRTVSDEADIPVSVLSLYTGQNVKRFDGETLQKLCRYFGVQPGDLLVFSEDPPTPKKKNAPKQK